MTHEAAWNLILGVAALLGVCGVVVHILVDRGIMK
jgi:hypothetical protein